MSSSERLGIDISPLVDWKAHYPGGFSGSRNVRVPTSDDMLLLGVDLSTHSGESRPASLTAGFDGEKLRVDLATSDDSNFAGLMVAVFNLSIQLFSRLWVELGEDKEVVRIGTGDELHPIPQGRRQTPLGTFDGMIAHAVGHTAIEVFAPKKVK